MARFLITARDGMLSRHFQSHPWFADHNTFGRQELDITNPNRIESVIDRVKPEIVINCAAYNNVPQAEVDDRDAILINTVGTGNLAEACRKHGLLFVHFGTDYIFRGDHGDHREDDSPAPLNRYGHSKLGGDLRVMETGGDWMIVRVSWLFGPGGRNFVSSVVQWLLERDEVSIVSDQYNKATYTGDVVEGVKNLISRGGRGLFHFANGGCCNRYEFTMEIARLLAEKHRVKARVKPILAADFSDKTPRPANGSMNTDRYKAVTGATIPHWKEALRFHLNQQGLI